ncbi:MAG: acyl-CoA dehydrogenase family protein [Bdellovibrionales bacterium]|nr:acyl-CoA dehydrogenase family protein [Bdellovibrionales bacterium]
MVWEDGSSLGLSEDEIAIRDAARSFAQSRVKPLAAEIDRDHRFPEELIPELGALGFLGACVPSEFGGAELSQVAYTLIVEELAAACASTSIIVSAHNSLCIAPILKFGSDAQKQEFLPSLASGAALGCFALSEPGSGSDAAALTCKAHAEGDEYIINGTKNWITNGPKANVCILIATTDTALGHKGVTAFVHPMDVPGFSRGSLEDKLGICGSPTSSLHYDNVRLKASWRLGDEGHGFRVAMETLNGGRTGVAAQAIGIARAALNASLHYAQERKAFGKPIGEHQSIQNYLADMITRIDAARLLNVSAAKLKDSGANYIREAAMAKLFASETATWVTNKAVQIHGGYGYVKDYPVERHFRDAKITEIYEGTSEIQRLVIASRLLQESAR